MSKSKLEYIWLDGYKPTASLRGKTKVVSDFSGKLEDCPVWAFDGSSTRQAEGTDRPPEVTGPPNEHAANPNVDK